MTDLIVPKKAAFRHHAAIFRCTCANGDIHVDHTIVNRTVLIPNLNVAAAIFIERDARTGIPVAVYQIGIVAACILHDPPAVPVAAPPCIAKALRFVRRFVRRLACSIRRWSGRAVLDKGHHYAFAHKVDCQNAVLQRTRRIHVLNGEDDIIAVKLPFAACAIAVKREHALPAGAQLNIVFALGVDLGDIHIFAEYFNRRADILS